MPEYWKISKKYEKLHLKIATKLSDQPNEIP